MSTEVADRISAVSSEAATRASALNLKAPLANPTFTGTVGIGSSQLSTQPLLSWVQRGSDIKGEAAGDNSGHSVSISADGNVVAIGANLNFGTFESSGHVRVYEWNNTNTAWVQRGQDMNGEGIYNQSGFSVSLSADGSVVAIGAISNNGGGSSRGHVRVYRWNGAAWVQRGLDIDGEADADGSGVSVSISTDGNVVAIGAASNDGNGSSSGHVRVYEWNNTAWVQRGSDIDGEAAGDNSGWSVSISADGSVVAIGARINNSTRGHVRVYRWNGTSWNIFGLDIDGEGDTDYSGYSVSISADGSVVAIGAIWNSSLRGHVRVYDWTNNAWVKRGSDIDGEVAGDQSGYSVSISADGSVVAIGAVTNGGNGSNSGHVRVYDWTNNAWTQRGSDIDGEAVGDRSGHSVSISANGNTVAIGAVQNDGNGSNSGHVRVYKWTSSSLNIPDVTFTGTVSGITKTMVGLGNVDNTSDTNKPVSTAQQTALNLKANLAGPTFTGTVSGITKTMVGLGNVDNTSDANKPVSTAQQSALDLKAPLSAITTLESLISSLTTRISALEAARI